MFPYQPIMANKHHWNLKGRVTVLPDISHWSFDLGHVFLANPQGAHTNTIRRN